jgi:hypothetical protein
MEKLTAVEAAFFIVLGGITLLILLGAILLALFWPKLSRLIARHKAD